jgi:hypothetical protein
MMFYDPTWNGKFRRPTCPSSGFHEKDGSGNRVRVDIRYIDLIRCAVIELVEAQDDLSLKFEFGWTQFGPDKFRSVILPLLKKRTQLRR